MEKIDNDCAYCGDARLDDPSVVCRHLKCPTCGSGVRCDESSATRCSLCPGLLARWEQERSRGIALDAARREREDAAWSAYQDGKLTEAEYRQITA